ncbi:MAG: hypothetical protein CMJ20_06780 [Phycisphaeraceae bacterium]|nr:hypothetical protein [Phycisphaeraceae bacterium]
MNVSQCSNHLPAEPALWLKVTDFLYDLFLVMVAQMTWTTQPNNRVWLIIVGVMTLDRTNNTT